MSESSKAYSPEAIDQMRADIARIGSQLLAATDVLDKFIEIMDGDEDGGDGVNFEDRLERLLPAARVAVESKP